MDIDPTTLTQIVIFFAVLLGVLLRTAMPYLKKAKEAAEKDPKASFDFHWSYALTFLIVFIESTVAAIIALPLLPADPTISRILLFCGAFAWAYMSNDIANRISS